MDITSFQNKLEALREYIFLKIEWDCQWPLMSFETYLEYRKEEPNINHWLRLLNGKEKSKRNAFDVIRIWNETGVLLGRSNGHRQYQNQGLAAMSQSEIQRNYYNRGIQNSQNRNLSGLLGLSFDGIVGIPGQSSKFCWPFHFQVPSSSRSRRLG